MKDATYFKSYVIPSVGRDSVVDTETSYGLNSLWIESR